MLLRLAFRNLRRHSWRTLATILGVGIGIAAVLATLSVGENVEANVAATLAAAAGDADLIVAPGAQGIAVFHYEELLRELTADPDVAAAYPVLNTRAEPQREVEEYQSGIIPGVDSGFQLSGRVLLGGERDPFRLAAGSLPVGEVPGAVMAGGFAELRGIGVGDTVTFETPAGAVLEVTITGIRTP